MKDLSNTQFFQVGQGPQIQARDILEIVYKALREKGYNPVNQMVGYIMSGDPTYITSHNGARSLVMKMERDELVEEMQAAIDALEPVNANATTPDAGSANDSSNSTTAESTNTAAATQTGMLFVLLAVAGAAGIAAYRKKRS